MTAPAFAEAVKGELGEYDVNNFERWSLFAPRRGQVITTELPGEVYGQEGIEAAFVVLSLAADGSLTRKSLGKHQPRGHELVVVHVQPTGWQHSHLLECRSVPGRRFGVPCPQVGALGWKHFPRASYEPFRKANFEENPGGTRRWYGRARAGLRPSGPPKVTTKLLRPQGHPWSWSQGFKAGGGAPDETAGMDALRGRLEKIKRKQQETAIGGLGGRDGGHLDELAMLSGEVEDFRSLD